MHASEPVQDDGAPEHDECAGCGAGEPRDCGCGAGEEVGMRLYELTGVWAELAAQAEEDGECNVAALADVEGAIEEKVERAFGLIRSIEGDVSILKAEESRLSARRRARENTVARLREYVRDCMDGAGISVVKGPTLTVSVSDGPPAVIVSSEEAVPDEYCATKRQPDKAAIKRAWLDDGECVPGTELVRKRVLRIR